MRRLFSTPCISHRPSVLECDPLKFDIPSRNKQMMRGLDQARSPREGEHLDLEKLEIWLKDSLPEMDGEVSVAQFQGGASNLTYLIKIGGDEVVLRRPPFGANIVSAHDMGREYRVLTRLNAVFPLAPKPLGFCDDQSVVGAPFLVMQRIKGVIIRRELPPELNLDSTSCRRLCENFLDVLLELHRLDFSAAGLKDLGPPVGYVERQVTGWNNRWIKARTEDVDDAPEVRDWLVEKQPGDSGLVGIIHNDYKFDNVVLDVDDPTRIVGVLDWEMATLGDPLMDLGCTMSYWVQADDPKLAQLARVCPTNEPGMLSREEMVTRYVEQAGLSLNNFDFYYAFGLFRLAVIAQQIYKRFYEGKTHDRRFAVYGQIAAQLNQTALEVTKRSVL